MFFSLFLRLCLTLRLTEMNSLNESKTQLIQLWFYINLFSLPSLSLSIYIYIFLSHCYSLFFDPSDSIFFSLFPIHTISLTLYHSHTHTHSLSPNTHTHTHNLPLSHTLSFTPTHAPSPLSLQLSLIHTFKSDIKQGREMQWCQFCASLS